VVTQISSVTRALQEVAAGLLNDHLAHCMLTAARAPDSEAPAGLDEVSATIRQVNAAMNTPTPPRRPGWHPEGQSAACVACSGRVGRRTP
jgi:Metal-sensitive transcriptional repressor